MLNDIYDMIVLYTPDTPQHQKILDIFDKDFDLVDKIEDMKLNDIARDGICEVHKTGFIQGFKYAVNLIQECKK